MPFPLINTTSRTVASATNSTTSASTYTTIPISISDVISRSIQNLSTFLSRCRPWPEFLATTSAIDVPSSMSNAGLRLRRNANYFSVNYAIIISACAAISLIGAPIVLLIICSIYFMWMILHFFREDPLLIWGRLVSDRAVIVSLVLVSIASIWFTGALNNLWIGIGTGLLVSAIHGVLRNPEGIFLDENDAVSNGLIASKSTVPSPHGGGISYNPPL